MTQSDGILDSINEIQRFAETNQHEGLLAGLKLALEAYINEAAVDEEARKTALDTLTKVSQIA